MALLRSTGKGAYYFAESDYDEFSILYLTEVENKRGDVCLFPTASLGRSYLPELLEHRYPGLDWKPFGSVFFPVPNPVHPSFYCAFPNGELQGLCSRLGIPFYFRPSGVSIQAFPHNPQPPFMESLAQLDDFWERYLKPGKRSTNPINGLFLELCAHPYINAADYLKLRDDLTQWDKLYDEGLSLIGEDPWLAEAWSQRAAGDLLLGEKPKALESYLLSAEIDLGLGLKEPAKTALQKVLELDPSNEKIRRINAEL